METQSISSVEDLLRLLGKYNRQYADNTGGYIFRGVSSESWNLLPSVYRKTDKEIIGNSRNVSIEVGSNIYRTNEKDILREFQRQASSLLPHIPASNLIMWMQYAQHYGVPTRLLDFTENPLIALFFCCKTKPDNNGALWIINTDNYSSWVSDDYYCLTEALFCTDDFVASVIADFKAIDEVSDRDRSRGIVAPVFFKPEYIDARMAAQLSCFLLWGKNTNPLESIVSEQKWMRLSDGAIVYDVVDDKRFLAKVTIPKSVKHNLLCQLDLLGVNERSIFPGVEGIAKYVERFYRNHADDLKW